MKKLNNKGFTLVELLVTIALVVIIMLIAFPAISGLMNSNKNTPYESYGKAILAAGKNYANKYSKDMNLLDSTTKDGLCDRIEYSNLKSSGLIKDFKYKNGEYCTYGDVCVCRDNLTKTTLFDYTLVCFNKKDEEIFSKTSDIACTGKYSDKDKMRLEIGYSPNKKTGSNKDLEVKMTVIGNYYEYKILKKNKTTNVFEEYKNVTKTQYKKPITIKLSEEGTYKIEGKAHGVKNQDSYTKMSPEYTIDKVPPKCGAVTGNETWATSSTQTITIKCIDNESGCKSESFSKSLSKDGYITIEDNGDNKTDCPVTVKIDPTPPVCGAVSGASKTWTNGNRTISVGCSDPESGCTQASFSKPFTDTETVGKIEIENNRGVKTSCPVDVYIDKTAPVLKSVHNPTNGNWTRNAFSLTLTGDDSHSGIAYYQYSYDNANFTTYSDSAKTTFTTTPYSAERNQYAYLRVIDKAGNISPSAATLIRIDRTPPNVFYIGGCPIPSPYTKCSNFKVTDNLSSTITVWYSHCYEGGNSGATQSCEYVNAATRTQHFYNHGSNYPNDNKASFGYYPNQGTPLIQTSFNSRFPIQYSLIARDEAGNVSGRLDHRHP